HSDNSEKALEEVSNFSARRVRLIPAGVGLGTGRQRCRRRQRWFVEVARDVDADGLADLLISIAVSSVDTVEVAHPVFSQIGHLRQAACDSSVMSVVSKAFMNAPVIAQAISSLQSISCCPRPGGNLHAIDGCSRHDLHAVYATAVEIKPDVSRHVIRGGVD